METKFKDVAHLYLGCDVQYTGILNGKDISKYRKEFECEHEDFMSSITAEFNPPNEITGVKFGKLKWIYKYKSGFIKVMVGKLFHGLKPYWASNMDEIKPILYPLSAMTDEQLERIVEIGEHIYRGESASQFVIGWRAFGVNTFTYLLSQSFDLFDLIGTDQAIDATLLVNKN